MQTNLRKAKADWNFEIGLQMVPNSRVPQIPQEKKRYQQMSEDIRHFTLRQSMPNIFQATGGTSPLMQQSASQTAFTNISSQLPEANDQNSPFALISNTFGFEHHPGTDTRAELKVLKLLLRRENLLLLIVAHADKLVEVDSMKGIKTVASPKRSEILDLLTRIREITVELIEAICMWRISGQTMNQEVPIPFLWKKSSYLLKIVYDLDFMGNTQPLYESLNIPREKLFNNPLMLPNTLREVEEWITPEESARADAGGKVESDFYRERLRLRKAEAILLQELQYESEYYDDYNVGGSGMKGIGAQINEPSEATAESSMFISSSLEESSFHMNDVKPDHYRNLQSRGSNVANASTSREGQRRSDREMYGDVDIFDDIEGDDEAYMDFRQQQIQCEEITCYDIETICNISSPSKSLKLAGAAIQILLAEGNEVPGQISWEAFLEMANIDDIAWDMNSIVPANIPRFKTRAIKPFLSTLESYVDSARRNPHKSNSDMSVFKVVKWVVKMLNSAVVQQGSSTEKISKTDKLLASITTSSDGEDRRMEKVKTPMVKRNKALRENKTVTNRPKLTPAERRKKGEREREKITKSKHGDKTALASQPKSKAVRVPKIEKQLCTLHTEMINGVFERPLFLTLLGPSYLLSGEDDTIPDRFAVKIYDPLTSMEVESPVNTREYTLLLRDLQNQFGYDLTAYFMPISYHWWAENLKNIIIVKSKPNNKLSLYISKKKIEDEIQRKFEAEYEKNGQGIVDYNDDFEDDVDRDFLDGNYLDEAFSAMSSRSSATPPAVIAPSSNSQTRPYSQPGQDRPYSQASSRSQERPRSQNVGGVASSSSHSMILQDSADGEKINVAAEAHEIPIVNNEMAMDEKITEPIRRTPGVRVSEGSKSSSRGSSRDRSSNTWDNSDGKPKSRQQTKKDNAVPLKTNNKHDKYLGSTTKMSATKFSSTAPLDPEPTVARVPAPNAFPLPPKSEPNINSEEKMNGTKSEFIDTYDDAAFESEEKEKRKSELSSQSNVDNVSYTTNSLMESADDPLDEMNMSSSIASEATSFVKEILKPYETKSKREGTDEYVDDFESVGGSGASAAVASADYDDDFERAPPNVAAARFPSDYSADFNAQSTGDVESQLGSSLGIFEDLDVSDGEGSTKYIDSFEGEVASR